jgi:outer membrane protein insertion porin family
MRLLFKVIPVLLLLLLGYGARVYLKAVIESQLRHLVQEEFSLACKECRVDLGQIDISLLTLSLTAKNARIYQGDLAEIEVPIVLGKVSLRRIFQRELFISLLQFNDGSIKGIAPSSALFKFINHISKPTENPPKPKIKVILEALEVNQVHIAAPLSRTSYLLSANSEVVLLRDGTEIGITVTLPDPQITPSLEVDGFHLGEIKAKLHTQPDTFQFEELLLQRDRTALKVLGEVDLKKDLQLKGSLSGIFNTSYINLQNIIGGEFGVDGQLGGTIEEPFCEGKSTLSSPLLELKVFPNKILTSITASTNFGLNEKGIFANLRDITGSNQGTAEPDLQILNDSTISYEDDRYNLILNFLLDEFTIAGITLKELLGSVTVTPDGVKIESNNKETEAFGTRIKSPLTNKITLSDKLILESKGESLTAFGEIEMPQNGTSSLNGEVNLTLKDHPLVLSSNDFYLGTLNGDTKIEGELLPDKFLGSGAFTLTPTSSLQEFLATRSPGDEVIQISHNIANGRVNGKFHNASKSLKGESVINFVTKEKSKLTLSLSNFASKAKVVAPLCPNLNGVANFNWHLSSPDKISGSIDVNKVILGCRSEVTISNKEPLPITDGVLTLRRLNAKGFRTSLRFGGSISKDKMDVAASGKAFLAVLEPFLPGTDEIGGSSTLNLKASGPLTAPQLTGDLKINNGRLVANVYGVNLDDLNGEVILNQSGLILIESLSGSLNGGSVTVRGQAPLIAPQKGNAQISLERIVWAPAVGATVDLDSELQVSFDEFYGQGKIAGTVSVRSAQLEKNITINSLLRDTVAIFNKRNRAPIKSRRNEKSSVAVDLSIQAPKNLNVLTNWLQSELKGEINVTGNVTRPRITGNLESVSGWFGLRNRRFEIVSANIEFPPSLENLEYAVPNISLLSEATLRTRQGETVLVFLEIEGPVTNPKITFSSNGGYSQSEILQMFALGGESSSETAGGLGLGLEYHELAIGQKGGAVQNFLHELSKIDNVTLEPTFNPITGGLDPGLFAEKELSEDLSITAVRVFSDTYAQSEAMVNLKVASDLSLSGGIRALVGQTTASPEVNLKYTLFSDQVRSILIKIRGNKNFNRKEILEAIRVREGSKLYVSELANKTLQLKTFYREHGFYGASIEMFCGNALIECTRLNIKIQEGKREILTGSRFEGELPIEISLPEILNKSDNQGEFVTKELRLEARDEVLRRLRKEGYLNAAVIAVYRRNIKSNERSLVIKVRAGMRYKFSFVGNKEFDEKELLETLDLDIRALPFGNSPERILAENVEREYREAGYLYATVVIERLNERPTEEKGELAYLIKIDEGPVVAVDEVVIRGLSKVTEGELVKAFLKQESTLKARDLLEPKYVIQEQIEEFAAGLALALRSLGYPKGDVHYEIADIKDNHNKVRIIYQVVEGRPQIFSQVDIRGWPSTLDSPKSLAKPYSLSRINAYLTRVLQKLREVGYREGNITLKIESHSESERHAILLVNPGPLFTISQVKIVGLERVKESLVREKLQLNVGDSWNETQFRRARTALFRLGLFSSIQLIPADGEVNSQAEDLLIEVRERAPRAVEIGGGFNSEFGAHLFFEGVERGIFADGRTLSLRSDLYYDPRITEISRGGAGVSLSTPDVLEGLNLLESQIDWVEDLSFQRLVTFNQSYDLIRGALLSFLTTGSGENINYFFGHSLLHDDTFDIEPDAVLSSQDEGTLITSALLGRMFLDFRDNPLSPSRGATLALEGKVASKVLLSESEYWSYDAKATYIVPIFDSGSRFTLGLSTRFGLMHTFGSSDEIPVAQRFYLGGRRTVRGFQENALGPRGVNGSIIGGDTVQANTVQLSAAVLESMSLHLFSDSGNVFLRSDDDASIGNLRYSAGFGIEYNSPIGPFGVDIGFPVDREPGERPSRLHFTFGTRF